MEQFNFTTTALHEVGVKLAESKLGVILLAIDGDPFVLSASDADVLGHALLDFAKAASEAEAKRRGA